MFRSKSAFRRSRRLRGFPGRPSASVASFQNAAPVLLSPLQSVGTEAHFLCLSDGPVFEVVESAHGTNQTGFAVHDSGQTFLADHVDFRGHRYVPPDRFEAGLGDIVLPQGVRDFVSAEQLFWWTHKFIQECVDLPIHLSLLAACFVAYTWFADRMPTAVYLHVTGLPQSGKTTLLEVLGLICRRPLLVSQISSSAAYDVCTRFGPTLIMDESDSELSFSNNAWRRQLRAGTKPGFVGKRRGVSSHTFGPKILCSLELSNDAALNTRCLHIPMQESNRTDLTKTHDPQLRAKARVLQQMWLRFRLENFRTIGPKMPDGAADLRPRSRDMAASLIGALPSTDKMYEQAVVEYFQLFHDPATRDVLSSKQRCALAGLFFVVHASPLGGSIQIANLAATINKLASAVNERVVFSPRELSPVLKSLGFTARERSAAGLFLPLDQDVVSRVHDLWRKYDCKSLAHPLLPALTAKCALCQNHDATKASDVKNSGETE